MAIKRNLGVLRFDNARIIYRNFAGAKTDFNRAGARNFALIIESEELAQSMIADGWNVKMKPPRDENEDSFYYLPIKVNFNGNGPYVVLSVRGIDTILDESNIDKLDKLNIDRIDLDVRAGYYDVNGKKGVSAYLDGMKVWQRYNRFEIIDDDEKNPDGAPL